jgi:hypothetical protein
MNMGCVVLSRRYQCELGCPELSLTLLIQVLGEEKSDFFLDKFLEYFFTEKDAEFFASLGLNCIRCV